MATAEDLEFAVERVLVSAQGYFFFTWKEDCSGEEKEVLRTIATNEKENFGLAEHQKALQSLCQKEIVERVDHRYQFTIDLFHRWLLKNQL